ncbi:MAG: phage holin family protein [Clostridia bacterium]
MEQFLQIATVPIIATLVFWIIDLIKIIVKENELFKRAIPFISSVLGAILGVVAYAIEPSIIPATDWFSAIMIGGASGLSATGTHQAIKQLSAPKNNSTKDDKPNDKPTKDDK